MKEYIVKDSLIKCFVSIVVLNQGIQLTVHKAGVDDPLISFNCTRECHFVRLRFTVPSLSKIKAASKK